MGMTKEEFLAQAAKIHNEWGPTAKVVVDPRYAGKSPSQYTEGIEATTPTAQDDRTYVEQINALIDEYDRSNGWPTRSERRAAVRRKRGAGEGMLTEGTDLPKGRPTEGRRREVGKEEEGGEEETGRGIEEEEGQP